MLLFSIIIPAYNAAGQIIKTLESVQQQTYRNYEVVITDDGSTDETESVIADYASKHPEMRIRVVSQENKGIGAARNAAINKSRGDFVAFLDSDDTWEANKLEEVNNVLKTDPTVDLVCHDEYVESEGQRIGLTRFKDLATHEELLFLGNAISTSTAVVKRARLIEGGLFSEDMDFNGVEDYELWLRLSKTCKFHHLHMVLGTYMENPSGISKNLPKQLQQTLNVIEYHFAQWPDRRLKYSLLMRKCRSRVYFGYGLKFNTLKRYKEGRFYALKAIVEYAFSWKALALLIFNMFHLSVNKIYRAGATMSRQ